MSYKHKFKIIDLWKKTYSLLIVAIQGYIKRIYTLISLESNVTPKPYNKNLGSYLKHGFCPWFIIVVDGGKGMFAVENI